MADINKVRVREAGAALKRAGKLARDAKLHDIGSALEEAGAKLELAVGNEVLAPIDPLRD